MEPYQCEYCRRHKNLGDSKTEPLADQECAMCGVTISYGPRSRKKISVTGSNHRQVLEVSQDLSKQHASKPLHTLITHWSFWFGSLLVISGTLITILGFTGEAEISLFGQTIKSTSVGITMGFLGLLSVSRNIKNVLHHDGIS